MKIQDILLSFFILAVLIFISSCGPNTIIDEQTAANDNPVAADTQTYLLKDATVRVLWHKQNGTISTTLFNKDYLDTMSDPERAALGFVSAFIKTDSGMNLNYSKGGTKLRPLLMFKKKSNEKKIAFLKKWFRYDKKCLNELENPSAFCNSQKEFEEIRMTVTADTIKIIFTAKEITPGRTANWRQEDTFRLDQNTLLLIEEKQSAIN
jgi:hypothetical protein